MTVSCGAITTTEKNIKPKKTSARMRQGGSSCNSDSAGAKRSSFSVPGSPLETHAADVSRSFISLQRNEMLVVVVEEGGFVSSGLVMIELERISRVLHTVSCFV